MEKKIQKIMREIENSLGENANVLLTTMVNDKCACSVHGDLGRVAQSIFAIMLDENNKELGVELYAIIKSITLNLLNNQTKFSFDLADAIVNVFNSEQEREEARQNNETKIIPLN